MRRYRAKHHYSWSSELAYCAGLLATDGCLSPDGRHIDFTSKDYELTKIYRAITRPEAKIGTKTNGRGQTAYRVQLGDTGLYDFLTAAGFTPKKSKTLGRILIPSSYYADFLRGCFDGDGTTYGFRDLRWKNSYMYYIEFTSVSINFLIWLRAENTKSANTTPGSLRNSYARAIKLSYAKRDAELLYEYMYYSRALPCLTRKKAKLESFFTI